MGVSEADVCNRTDKTKQTRNQSHEGDALYACERLPFLFWSFCPGLDGDHAGDAGEYAGDVGE